MVGWQCFGGLQCSVFPGGQANRINWIRANWPLVLLLLRAKTAISIATEWHHLFFSSLAYYLSLLTCNVKSTPSRQEEAKGPHLRRTRGFYVLRPATGRKWAIGPDASAPLHYIMLMPLLFLHCYCSSSSSSSCG